MLNYAVVKISGKQYKVEPEKEFLVAFLGDIKNFECDQVLIKAEDDKVTVGAPFLKEKLKFEILASVNGPKIRVAKYHAKANSRRVRGFKSKLSRIKLVK